MRKLFIILAAVFAVVGLVFAILPMGSIAFLPIILAIVLALVAMWKSNDNQKKIPKWILVIALAILVLVTVKVVFVKDKVVVDQQFIQENVDSKEEAQQELEGLE
ncbi:MAG TPA: hypothetical protein PK664_08710 [Paludibacteraceae bacterium]|jgi:uncharacterized membrane protein|nr:hypothetical protein [Paludibacteraceae bacterium]HPS11441.1 hypothetical protein [Paludibacteraceae bacterium]